MCFISENRRSHLGRTFWVIFSVVNSFQGKKTITDLALHSILSIMDDVRSRDNAAASAAEEAQQSSAS